MGPTGKRGSHMHYHRRREWEIPASETTPESVFLGRRAFLAGAGAIAASGVFARGAFAEDADPSAALYPAKHNDACTLDREVTPEKINENYNNFYEFSTNKHFSADP